MLSWESHRQYSFSPYTRRSLSSKCASPQLGNCCSSGACILLPSLFVSHGVCSYENRVHYPQCKHQSLNACFSSITLISLLVDDPDQSIYSSCRCAVASPFLTSSTQPSPAVSTGALQRLGRKAMPANARKSLRGNMTSRSTFKNHPHLGLCSGPFRACGVWALFYICI